jgi:hypothetical protein
MHFEKRKGEIAVTYSRLNLWDRNDWLSRGIGSNYGGVEHVLDEFCPGLAAFGHKINFADAVNRMPDSNETNNTLSQTIQVLWQPELNKALRYEDKIFFRFSIPDEDKEFSNQRLSRCSLCQY